MIKTTIEWYTLDEKLPFDGDLVTEERYEELLGCINMFSKNWGIDRQTVEVFRYLNGQFTMYYDGDGVDFTEDIEYWAYVPKIGVE